MRVRYFTVFLSLTLISVIVQISIFEEKKDLTASCNPSFINGSDFQNIGVFVHLFIQNICVVLNFTFFKFPKIFLCTNLPSSLYLYYIFFVKPHRFYYKVGDPKRSILFFNCISLPDIIIVGSLKQWHVLYYCIFDNFT